MSHKVKKPEMDKLARPKDLVKEKAEASWFPTLDNKPKEEVKTVIPAGGCTNCGNPNLYHAARGAKCLKCGTVFSN